MTQRCLTGMVALGLVSLTGAEPPAKRSLVTFEFLTGETTRKVVIELDEARAPQTCANFRQKVESGYYNGMAVHRVIPNYLVQMGDPYTREPGKKHMWGTGGPEQTVPAELGGKHIRGSLAMARLPDAQNPRKESSGSQFYVALDDLKQLDGDYTVFAKVVRGIEHFDYMSLLTADTNDVPVSRVEIHKTGLGEEIRSSTLAERAVKPVAVAAEGIKDVSKGIASNIPLLGKKDEGGKKDEEPHPLEVVPPAEESAPPPDPSAGEPVTAEVPEQAKRSLLAKLAPPKLLVLGRKKDTETETEPSTETLAAPAGDPAEAEGRKRLLPFGHKKDGASGEVAAEQAAVTPVQDPATGEGRKRLLPFGDKSKKSAESAAPATGPAAPAKPASEPVSPASAAKKEKKEDKKEEKKNGDDRKGFFGRMLEKVR